MFDRTVHVAPPEVHVAPPSVTITMPPANAVDAARLYGELRKEAEDDVKHALLERMGANNELVVVKVEHLGNLEKNTRHVRLLFRINGISRDITTEDTQEAMEAGMHYAIAEALISLVFAKIMPRRGPV